MSHGDFEVSQWMESNFGNIPEPAPAQGTSWAVPDNYQIDEAMRLGCVVKEVADDGWIQTIPAELEALLEGL